MAASRTTQGLLVACACLLLYECLYVGRIFIFSNDCTIDRKYLLQNHAEDFHTSVPNRTRLFPPNVSEQLPSSVAPWSLNEVKPLKVCGGALQFIYGFCASDKGYCRATGIFKSEFAANLTDIFQAIYFTNNATNEIYPKRQHVFRPHERHTSAFDAFTVHFLDIKNTEVLNALNIPECRPNSFSPRRSSFKTLPLGSKVFSLNDKIVLFISQFYSKIDLNWVRFYLEHYLKLGVDNIVLYTTFDSTLERYFYYSQSLNALLKLPEFVHRVERFDYSGLGERMHSHGQLSILHHACTRFFGATILTQDMDELIVSTNNETIRQLVNRLNILHDSWNSIIWPYTLNKRKFFARMSKKNAQLSDVIQDAKYCDSGRHQCRVKWIYRSLSNEFTNIHLAHFGINFTGDRPTKIDKLDKYGFFVLHIEGIQGCQGCDFKRFTCNKSFELTDIPDKRRYPPKVEVTHF
mmetsp:Transcript_10058/g.11546  ORF Transcript_10058/g.11546 Transcript_10058/m.11546 type:complete len:463 (-) Transcript_10058:92-1480(-)